MAKFYDVSKTAAKLDADRYCGSKRRRKVKVASFDNRQKGVEKILKLLSRATNGRVVSSPAYVHALLTAKGL